MSRRPTFISTFAGIGGFDAGLERAGWECIGQVEIDSYCQKVLKKHWPDVPLHNDIRTAKEWWLSEEDRPKVDLVCGGFPCQDVSVAGKRAGLGALSDDVRTRTGLFYDAIDFIAAVQPAAVLLENVPGLFTSQGGADFLTVLDSLAEVGFVDLEWRVLDSQFFGVPQRRRRIFVVGRTGDARRGPVLLEPEGSSGDPDASKQARKVAARPAAEGARGGGVQLALDPDDPDDVAAGRVVGPLQAQGTTGGFRFDADGAGGGHILPVLANPVGIGGPARSLVTGGRSDSGDGSRSSFVITPGDPQERMTGWPDPAGTVTTRIGKGVNTTADDGAMVYGEVGDGQEDRAPKRRVIRRVRDHA